MKKIKIGHFVMNALLGANIATAIIMVLTGYSYLVDPLHFPLVGIFGLVFPLFIVFNIAFILFWVFVCWHNIFVSIIAFLFCYNPVTLYIGINASQDIPDNCIKVMSFNVMNFHGLEDNILSRDSNKIVYYIEHQNCDIVCLQEASMQALGSEMREKLDSIYPYINVESRDGNSLCLLSKYKIEKAEIIPYESKGNFSMSYRLQGDFGNLVVINNHLESNHFSNEEKERFGSMIHGKMTNHEMEHETRGVLSKLIQAILIRNPQAKAVANFVKKNEKENIILCGDFNEWPISYTHHIISSDLTDCFQKSGKGLGWSYTHNGMRVRIDNIMCSKDMTPYRCYVDSKVSLSDHFPILCWVKIPQK